MGDGIDRKANKNKRDLTPAEKDSFAGIAQREMSVMKAGAEAQAKGGGSKEMEKAMNTKRYELKAKLYGRWDRSKDKP
jgi:hypothetical protein